MDLLYIGLDVTTEDQYCMKEAVASVSEDPLSPRAWTWTSG